MLSATHRLRHAHDFSRAFRSGQKASSRLLVVYVAKAETARLDSADAPSDRPAQVGFVVSKAVGTAVVRARVKRRLRHLMRSRIEILRAGHVYVIRVNPAGAAATSPELASDLDRCLARVEDGRR